MTKTEIKKYLQEQQQIAKEKCLKKYEEKRKNDFNNYAK